MLDCGMAPHMMPPINWAAAAIAVASSTSGATNATSSNSVATSQQLQHHPYGTAAGGYKVCDTVFLVVNIETMGFTL